MDLVSAIFCRRCVQSSSLFPTPAKLNFKWKPNERNINNVGPSPSPSGDPWWKPGPARLRQYYPAAIGRSGQNVNAGPRTRTLTWLQGAVFNPPLDYAIRRRHVWSRSHHPTHRAAPWEMWSWDPPLPGYNLAPWIHAHYNSQQALRDSGTPAAKSSSSSLEWFE